MFGSQHGGPESNLLNLFRTDQAAAKPADASISPSAFLPWGMQAECVTNTRANPDRVGFTRPSPSAEAEVDFAGISGDDGYVADIDEALRQGVSSIVSDGVVLVSDPDYPLLLPSSPETALAFSAAMSFVDSVWERVTGKGLTIENYRTG